jgi:hypothetical protein
VRRKRNIHAFFSFSSCGLLFFKYIRVEEGEERRERRYIIYFISIFYFFFSQRTLLWDNKRIKKGRLFIEALERPAMPKSKDTSTHCINLKCKLSTFDMCPLLWNVNEPESSTKCTCLSSPIV